MIKFFPDTRIKILALLYGLICHGFFAFAAILMVVCLYTGFSWRLHPPLIQTSSLINAILLVQFPFFHSFLLTKSGKKVLRIFFSPKLNNKLDTTTYATIASFQLIILFLYWQPTGVQFWVAEQSVYIVLTICYIFGWLLLAISSTQAGLQLQTGSLGWISLYTNKNIKFPDMPIKGLFSIVRHPIYLSFCIILWVSPYFTLDKLIIATSYTLYCYFAPILKEKRFTSIYGSRFRVYKMNTPYFFPKISSLFK